MAELSGDHWRDPTHDHGCPGCQEMPETMVTPGYRCRYCRRPMPVSARVYDENPFCSGCLHERMARASDPLDGPRLECGLPLPGATRYEG